MTTRLPALFGLLVVDVFVAIACKPLRRIDLDAWSSLPELLVDRARPIRRFVRVCEEDGAAVDTTMDFEELVEAESRGLIAAVYAIVGDQHRSEEIVQEAFERGYRRWRRVSRLDRPGAWVRRVAVNEAISTTRRRATEQRALARLEGLADRGGGRDPVAALDDEGIWVEVRRLPADQAAVVALRYGADLSVGDIAETMQITVAAVKSLLHRARVSLRKSSELQSYAK